MSVHAESSDRYAAAVLDPTLTDLRPSSGVEVIAETRVAISQDSTVSRLSENAAAWLVMATLAWAQFPLGSNRPWSWSLLVLLIAVAWVVWLPRALSEPRALWTAMRPILIPGALLVLVVVWAAIQTVPWTPELLHNGIWQIVPGGAHGAISVNPYETATEAMKLGSYGLAGALAFALARRHEVAHRVFLCVVVVGFFYAAYGLYLVAIGSSQLYVLTSGYSPYGKAVAGGFVSKNSFATFDALSLVVCAALIAERAGKTIQVSRGPRHCATSLVQFLLGRSAFLMIAAAVMFLALVLADSRAGMLAGLSGLSVLFAFAVVLARKRRGARWAMAGGLAALAGLALVFVLSGDTLAARFNLLVETRSGEELRPVMWGAALQSISAHPWTGTGLGTFSDVYPLYADRFVPYVVDRAHSDYLELALGLGIPVATLCLGALAWLVLQCVVGASRRRRRRIYAVAAVAAATVVAVHSLVDFSLQMPAVSLLFAIVLGVGVAQAMPSHALSSDEARV